MTEEASQVKPVVVKGVAIGGGMPKIMVPLTGASAAQLRAQAAALPLAYADIVEWHADFFWRAPIPASVLASGRALADRAWPARRCWALAAPWRRAARPRSATKHTGTSTWPWRSRARRTWSMSNTSASPRWSSG